MAELVFLKLGGSLITDKRTPLKPRRSVIRRIGREIRQALDQSAGLQLLLGHGSGSYGHPAAEKYRVQEGLLESNDWWGYAETAAIAARLNRLVSETLLAQGIPALPLQPSASALCQDGRLVRLDVAPLQEALNRRLVPVVYGDVSFDTVRGSAVISTEQIFAYLAPYLQPSRVILAAHVDGVFTADPLRAAGTRLLPEISASAFGELEPMLDKSANTDVTGGMLGKVRAMCHLIENQPELTVRIFSGERAGSIKKALLDPNLAQGTLIHS